VRQAAAAAAGCDARHASWISLVYLEDDWGCARLGEMRSLIGAGVGRQEAGQINDFPSRTGGGCCNVRASGRALVGVVVKRDLLT
jgi:hypothetical protein